MRFLSDPSSPLSTFDRDRLSTSLPLPRKGRCRLQTVQKSPRLIDEDKSRQALLRGRELTAVRDVAGNVTHYRFVGTPSCITADTFDALAADGLLEETLPGNRWALARPA